MSLSASTGNGHLLSKCSCGSVIVKVALPGDTADSDSKTTGKCIITTTSKGNNENANHLVKAVDCYCRSCRKYHISAFTSYLVLKEDDIEFVKGQDDITTYRDGCDEVGLVDRIYCKKCYSKIATRCIGSGNIVEPVTNEGQTSSLSNDASVEKQTAETARDTTVLLNMGTLVDNVIPKAYNTEWKKNREKWQENWKATWTDARPAAKMRPLPDQEKTVTGGCACGKCRYKFSYNYYPMELQHCYCKLCRRLSGGPFMTWVPVDNNDWKWTDSVDSDVSSRSKYLSLVATSGHGKRHVCTNCGSVLTIVYNDDPDATWPAAGGFDDHSLPSTTKEMSSQLSRVVHICCTWKQPWYELPKDRLPKIDYAC